MSPPEGSTIASAGSSSSPPKQINFAGEISLLEGGEESFSAPPLPLLPTASPIIQEETREDEEETLLTKSIEEFKSEVPSSSDSNNNNNSLLDIIMSNNAMERQGSSSSSLIMPSTDKIVSFDRIHIREYSRCLGDNPAAKSGPPLSIDWNYEELNVLTVDDYESARSTEYPRVGAELLVPPKIREQIIKKHTTATEEEIKTTKAEMKKIREERQMSFALQEFETLVIIKQSMGRKLKRLRKRLKQKKSTQKSAKNKTDECSETLGESDELNAEDGQEYTASEPTSADMAT